MKTMALLAAPLLMFASSGAVAQTTAHEQHQASGQHQMGDKMDAAEGEHRCCCEDMMKEMHAMMTQMKEMHQGMGAGMKMDGKMKDMPTPEKK